MKGLDLIIKICVYVALALGVLMSILNFADSWSEHHYTAYDPLLYTLLLSIVITFLSASSSAKDKFKELTAVYLFGNRISYRLEHALRITAFLFCGVIIFGVNNTESIFGVTIQTLHLVFTGLAIVSGYVTMLLYAESQKARLASYIGLGFGLVGFMLGFAFNVYSVSWAETLASIPLAVLIFYINKK
jgi:hypothetical protein